VGLVVLIIWVSEVAFGFWFIFLSWTALPIREFELLTLDFLAQILI
jgi:hypothetical protein